MGPIGARRSAIVLVAVLSLPAAAATDGALKILTFPIGLVTGEHLIEVDLGPTGPPAELYLDGEMVCSPDPADPRCVVDLGESLRVHLLELIRRDDAGDERARAERWINRPGQEAELAIHLAERTDNGVCGGRVIWLHPLKLDPAVLDVSHNGRHLRMMEDGGSFAFPCPDPAEPALLVASAVFPNGGRAEAVTMAGGFSGRAGVTATAVPLVAEASTPMSCEGIAAGLQSSATAVVDAGFETVFVLDPYASYRGLIRTAGGRGTRSNAWRRCEASLFNAEKMWFVIPNADLHRFNGFGGNSPLGYRSSPGRANWLNTLFQVGTTPITGDVRLADAVAASGLVAAAGPRRRTIVLILGNNAERDDSLFSAQQALAYLAEIAVPLLVIRTGKVRDDGWPKGVKIHNLQALANTFDTLMESLDRQCMVWFQGEHRLARVASTLPQGVAIAGRRDAQPANVEETQTGGVDKSVRHDK